ncbi:BZ3500_MvSof-1268-A1-R1_Chr8-2g10293 [Microbotryum saponariae]|uniref:BZ3500_MvSof-1268-A1-R1_Chr8-2g10293 protein n=1 Tax=Microbotryum saponariae TaxID=289078 RepID=A0A2X0MV98_9BASI|nr:BZ3500_MvSof-1268-A1-R1_Chr8-2g10293 [Microbotryum saponariae]
MIFVSVSVLGSVLTLLSLAQVAATLSVSKNNFGNPSTEQPEPVAAPRYNIAFRGVTDKNGFIVPEKLMEDLDRLNKRFNRTIVDIEALHPLAASTAAPILDGPHRFVRRAPAVTTTSATPLPTSKGKKCSPGFLNKNACVKVCPDKLLADTKAANCVPCPAQATCKQGLVTTCQSGWLINPTKTACIACPTHAVCRNGVVSGCDTGLLINAQQTACGACPRRTICTGGKVTSCQLRLLLNAAKACVACPANGVCSNGALTSCRSVFAHGLQRRPARHNQIYDFVNHIVSHSHFDRVFDNVVDHLTRGDDSVYDPEHHFGLFNDQELVYLLDYFLNDQFIDLGLDHDIISYDVIQLHRGHHVQQLQFDPIGFS